jgi:hypothetical protein
MKVRDKSHEDVVFVCFYISGYPLWDLFELGLGKQGIRGEFECYDLLLPIILQL